MAGRDMGKDEGSVSWKALNARIAMAPQKNWQARPAIAAVRYWSPILNRVRKNAKYFLMAPPSHVKLLIELCHGLVNMLPAPAYVVESAVQ